MSLDTQRGAALLTQSLAQPDHFPTISKLVAHCRRLALRYVRRKTSPAQLEMFGLTAGDLAIDSIAELFEKSEEGELLRLQEHFAPSNGDSNGDGTASVDNTADEKLERRLRRLVAGAVSDRLFRVYQEHDPGLARLIRNLKRAARRAEACTLTRAEGRLWLASTERPVETAQPLLPTPTLEDGLRQYLRGSTSAPEAVKALLALFRTHPHCRNGYPVSSFAVVLRAATARMNLPFTHLSFEGDRSVPGGLSTEMETLVGWRLLQALTETRAACFTGYVDDGKVPAPDYEAYFRAIRDVLIAEFVDLREDLPPLRSFLEEHLDEKLPSAHYRETHRNTFEYLLDLARRELTALLREDLNGDGTRKRTNTFV